MCGYLDFKKNKNHPLFLTVITKIIEQISMLNGNFQSVYVGGGIPSALPENELIALLRAIKPQLKGEHEYTFEVNPEFTDQQMLGTLVNYGVNRIAIGRQITDDDIQSKFKNLDVFYNFERTIKQARDAGIKNISIDVIYGFPKQTVKCFSEKLEAIVKLKPQHIALTAFNSEDDSALSLFPSIESDLETDLFMAGCNILIQAGYDHYELTNFAWPNYQCQHSLNYWHYNDYQAVGPGASLKVDHQRKTWSSDFLTYLSNKPYNEVIDLATKDEMFEYIMMGIRLLSGISLSNFQARFQCSIFDIYSQAINKSQNQGLLQVTDTRIKPTKKGLLLLDELMLNFM